MARNFKVNSRVRIIATNEIGTIKGREITSLENSKHVKLEYIVKVGNGFKNWKAYPKNALEPIKSKKETPKLKSKVYEIVDGYKVTMVALVKKERKTVWSDSCLNTLSIGITIYNPQDEYDETLGVRIARKRAKTQPFCLMTSEFSGAFNDLTVENIMDAKADYVKNNFDKFINKTSSLGHKRQPCLVYSDVLNSHIEY